MDKTITDNLRYAKIAIEDMYQHGYDVYLEIPEFFIIPGTENYKAFGLDLLHNQLESKLEFVRVVHPRTIEENHIRLQRGERTGQFDLTAENFKKQIFDFLYPRQTVASHPFR